MLTGLYLSRPVVYSGISVEELSCKDQELSFKILQCKLKENIYIETFNQDTLKT